jgi:hypothetical protein
MQWSSDDRRAGMSFRSNYWWQICSGEGMTRGRHVMEQLFLKADMYWGSYDQGQA